MWGARSSHRNGRWTAMDAGKGRGRRRDFFPSNFFRWVVFPHPKQPHSTNFCKSRVCGTAYGVVNTRVASEWATSSDGRRQRRRQGIKSNRTHPPLAKKQKSSQQSAAHDVVSGSIAQESAEDCPDGDRGCGGRRPWLACFFCCGCVIDLIR